MLVHPPGQCSTQAERNLHGEVYYEEESFQVADILFPSSVDHEFKSMREMVKILREIGEFQDAMDW